MFAMLKSVEANYGAVKQEIIEDGSYDLLLTNEELKDMQELIKFLGVCALSTKRIQSSLKPSLSLAVFMR